MKMDDLLANTKRLDPPDTLWQKVEKEIADGDQEEKSPGFMEWIPNLIGHRKPIWAMAAVAAAVILTIRLTPAPEVVVEPVPKDDTAEINQFIDDTLGSVFTYDSDFDSSGGNNTDNSTLSLSEGLDNILWINGGDNA